MKNKPMNIKTHKIRNDWSPLVNHGWGNGYIGIPREHPWYALSGYEIPASVHGGITWSNDRLPNNEPDGLWWIGFDTFHYEDTQENCPESYVDRQIAHLVKQAQEAITAN